MAKSFPLKRHVRYNSTYAVYENTVTGEVYKRATCQREARKHKMSECSDCGALDNLEVHHKDGEWWNNRPSNLVTLCRRCHNQEHAADAIVSGALAGDLASMLLFGFAAERGI